MGIIIFCRSNVMLVCVHGVYVFTMRKSVKIGYSQCGSITRITLAPVHNYSPWLPSDVQQWELDCPNLSKCSYPRYFPFNQIECICFMCISTNERLFCHTCSMMMRTIQQSPPGLRHTLRSTATQYTLQHTVTHYSTLNTVTPQHTATLNITSPLPHKHNSGTPHE